MKLIVGLGNPGREYEYNRHNIAWKTLEQLSFSTQLFWKSKFKGQYTQSEISGEKYYFLMPETYMNLSGESVRPLCDFFKIKIEDVLVIHDELDLPFGTLAFKNGGGLAGHNGLKSIAKNMGAQNFLRLRMGIGRPPRGSVSNWVLSDFSKEEEINLEDFLNLGATAIELFIKDGFNKAAREYSKKSVLT